MGSYMAGKGHTEAACLVLPDHFGWKGPHIHRLCDDLAETLQACVVCPDIHRGDIIDKWVQEMVLCPNICSNRASVELAVCYNKA